MDEEYKGTILYELICCSEWQEEYEEIFNYLSPRGSTGLFSYLNPRSYFSNKKFSLLEYTTWIKSLYPHWQYAVSFDGKIIAVLQNYILETRSYKDNFSTVLGKNAVIKDQYPNFRSLTWSKDSSILAVSFTNGQIVCFDIMASQLFSVFRAPAPSIEDKLLTNPYSIYNSLVGFFFVDERIKNSTFLNEIVCVDLRGRIFCYRQSTPDQMILYHETSFKKFYPKGVSSAIYLEKQSLILVAGNLDISSIEFKSNKSNLNHGITAWRLINDHPYYKIVFNVSGSEMSIDTRSLWRSAFSAITKPKGKVDELTCKLSSSPDGNLAAAVHLDGAISIWHLPSLKLYRFWPLKSQFHYKSENQRFNSRWRLIYNHVKTQNIDNWRFHPAAIKWWNNKTIIVARLNGCVSLCSLDEEYPSKNLLGDSPEFFESPVTISDRFDKGIFVFENEIGFKNDEAGLMNSSSGPLVESHSRIKNSYLEVLFWLTDSEIFRPPRKVKKRGPFWKETFRLFNLKSITPIELFHRKIDNEEYGEAIDLAKAYKLDCDIVFQRQWTKHPVSIITIKDYLAKIQKRNWVLQECLERVPDNIDAARELLRFGLRGTDVNAAVMISQGKDKGRFNLWRPEDLDISEKEYLTLVDKDNMEVKRLLKYRKQFLFYLEILNTYESILGGFYSADENFDPKEYEKLRRQSPFESSIEMAKNSDINGLKILFSNHWEALKNSYLDVLSSFPETTPPHDYRDFLPELDEDGSIYLWDDINVKEKDWCYDFMPDDDVDENSIKIDKITGETVEKWYIERIKDIEKFSGFTNHSLDLARLGLQRNITELRYIFDDLETLEILVYELNFEDMTLLKLGNMSSFEQLKLLMSKSSEDTFVHDFREFGIPFLEKCQKRNPGLQFYLLNQYLTAISENNLNFVLKIFENSKRENSEPLIEDMSDLMQLAYNCIYTCKNPKQNENILAILGCIPDRGYGIQVQQNKNKNEALEKLHDDLDSLETHFNVSQILSKYYLFMNFKSIQKLAEEEDEEIIKFLKKICNNASKLSETVKITEWKSLLYDLLDLQKKIFTNLPPRICYEIYVEALLKSGHIEIIKLSRDFLEQTAPLKSEGAGSGGRRNSSAYSTSFALYLYLIPYDQSLKMILQAAELYFDSASNYLDHDIELAKVCLNLMLIQNSKNPQISHMFDLIEAVKLINKDFQLNVLPQSVRLNQNKLELLKSAMLNIPGGYKKTKQLHKLGLFLRIDNLDLSQIESLILEMAGDVALTEVDMKFCVQICQNIMAKNYESGWKVFTQLAKYQSDVPIIDNTTRLSFINYALNICPDSEIFSVLNVKYIIEIRNLRATLNEFPSEECKFFEEFDDLSEEQKKNKILIMKLLKIILKNVPDGQNGQPKQENRSWIDYGF